MPMLSFFRRLMVDDKAATAIEYTLIASLIAVAAIPPERPAGNIVASTAGRVRHPVHLFRLIRVFRLFPGLRPPQRPAKLPLSYTI
jgi:pilus assembly protein Flp/PilA